MSKSTGNVVDPLVMIGQYGTDAFRFTLTAFAAQGREIRMDEERVDGYRKFINKLWNAARFAQMHIKDADPAITGVAARPDKLPLPHRWILSRTNATIRQVRAAMEGYNFNEIASSIYQFTWHEFCDWYLEWIKSDLYGDDEQARNNARGVLLCVLEDILKMMHPITPFVTEEIWSQLPGERGTIMLESFPEENPAWDDAAADQSMNLLMEVISAIRTIRSEADVHPTAKINAAIICPDPQKQELIQSFADAIGGMTRTDSLEITASGTVPDDAGHVLVGDIEVFVPLKGLIDVEGELAKLDREHKKIDKELMRVAGKLRNQKFLDNAPEAVVQKEKAKQKELETRLAKNAESVARLEKLQ
jgi:valyl-tRNA synthetase